MDKRKLIVKLQENVTSNKLRSGKNIAEKGRVIKLGFEEFIDNRDMKRIRVSSIVESEAKFNMYNVKMLIGVERGRIVQTSCECLDYHTNNSWAGNYICKHIAASYYVFIDKLIKMQEEETEDSYLEKTGGNLLEDINDIFAPKEGIKLQVNLNKKAVYRLEYFEADFKIGNKKMYVLKNLRDFTAARIKNTSLEYGKDFKYNPKTYEFSEEDEKIVEFIEDFVLTKGLLVDQSNGLNIGSSKYLKIPITSLRRFLEIVSHKKLNYGGETVKILKKDMPLEIKVSNEDEHYALSILSKGFKPLSERWDAFLFENNIYLPSKKQIDTLKILSRNIGDREKVLFKKENGEKFFNDVVSILKDVCKEVEYDETIDIIEGRELTAEFYFDENRKNILLYCKLIYGDEEVDLLKDESTGKIIIRNKNKELDILKEIYELKFLLQGKSLVFNGEEEDLYYLLTDGYRKLEKYGEVFYSDRFKNRKIYETPIIEGDFKESSDGYLDFSFEIEEINPKEYKDILESFRNKKKFHKLKDDSFINLEDNKLKEILGVIDKVVHKEKEINKIRLHKNRSILLNEFINKKELSFIKGKDLVKKTVAKIENLNNNVFEIPSDLNATLREYQITGFNWFKNLSFLGFGGVLADEMGLGKTLQAISFILSEKDKKTLIVAPTSLIYNWKNEFKKFAPTLKIAIVHGNKEDRENVIKSYNDYDVILTTYGTLRNDEESYKKIIFDNLIIDEAQNIKNPKALSTKTIKKIKSKVKFALTGTPIENNLVELWSIFDFVMPGYLYAGSEFKKRFIDNKEGTVELQKYIKPFMLRRLKRDVISELPEKIEKKHYVELTKEQRKVYSTYVDDIKEKMADESFEGDKITIFSYLTKLRQLCLEPSLQVAGYTGGNSKLDATIEIINEAIDGNHKVLLFSQFTSVLSVISKKLDECNIKYSYLDGSTKASKRLDLVDEFNNSNEKSVFLISLKAGGTGLNLTSADIVIHYDPWWNPAIEEQATDRAHRIGQKNVVEVIKLIAEGTIEERIINLQEEKKELINNVMSGGYEGNNILTSLSSKELIELFID